MLVQAPRIAAATNSHVQIGDSQGLALEEAGGWDQVLLSEVQLAVGNGDLKKSNEGRRMAAVSKGDDRARAIKRQPIRRLSHPAFNGQQLTWFFLPSSDRVGLNRPPTPVCSSEAVQFRKFWVT